MRHAPLVACLLLATASCSKPPAWEALPLGTSADFRAISFTDADHGWIAGGGYNITGGLIGRTQDGGKTWKFTSNLTERDRMSVLALHMFDAKRGIASTGSGDTLSTTDGGDKWTVDARHGHADSLASLFFLDERRGWAAGHGDVLRTDDGGDTWTSLTPAGVDTAYRSPMRAVQFQDDRRGWVAGMQASLMRTTDGGVTWGPAFADGLRRAGSAATPLAAGAHPNFWDLFFVDEFTGWVAGEEGTILTTRDSGSTWTRQDMGLKDAPGFTISAVRFVDANHGWITGFYPNMGRSLILRTADAGATWVIDADIAGEELYTLFVQGRERLWAVGARVREGPQSIYRRAITK